MHSWADQGRNSSETMDFIKQVAEHYDPDPDHSRHVTFLALTLFDGLVALHGLDPERRRLLEIAGNLHDIGWSRVNSGKHHKQSSTMIGELEIPGLNRSARDLCALIARYHTKAVPDPKRHRRFRTLGPDQRDLVEWLAGILRVADGLDCSHESVITNISCSFDDHTLTIHLHNTGPCQSEVSKARTKQELLEKKTGRRIIYKC
ncbi:HD domain-containing protein [bacterium]|nr:HD domain-containing protein [bacterium]